jgi:hypothetical protein
MLQFVLLRLCRNGFSEGLHCFGDVMPQREKLGWFLEIPVEVVFASSAGVIAAGLFRPLEQRFRPGE